MVFETLVAAALGAHLRVSEPRASYLASSVVYAVGENVEGAAAMIVNLHAESGGLEVYERCLLPEKGGWGAFGNAWFWEKDFPGCTCGPIDVQAKAAWSILRWEHYDDPAVAFGHYIGVKARRSRPVEDHPEAKRRAGFHAIIVWEMEHMACL